MSYPVTMVSPSPGSWFLVTGGVRISYNQNPLISYATGRTDTSDWEPAILAVASMHLPEWHANLSCHRCLAHLYRLGMEAVCVVTSRRVPGLYRLRPVGWVVQVITYPNRPPKGYFSRERCTIAAASTVRKTTASVRTEAKSYQLIRPPKG